MKISNIITAVLAVAINFAACSGIASASSLVVPVSTQQEVAELATIAFGDGSCLGVNQSVGIASEATNAPTGCSDSEGCLQQSSQLTTEESITLNHQKATAPPVTTVAPRQMAPLKAAQLVTTRAGPLHEMAFEHATTLQKQE